MQHRSGLLLLGLLQVQIINTLFKNDNMILVLDPQNIGQVGSSSNNSII